MISSDAAKQYLMIKPASLSDAFHLYSCYFRASTASIFQKDSFLTVGQYLKHDVYVIKDSIKVFARKHTEDIGYYATITKPWTRRWFRPSHGEIVVDCGSSVGIFSLFAGKQGSTVYAFEANPQTYGVLMNCSDCFLLPKPCSSNL